MYPPQRKPTPPPPPKESRKSHIQQKKRRKSSSEERIGLSLASPKGANGIKHEVQDLVAHQTKMMLFWEQKFKAQWDESNEIRSELEQLKQERESDQAFIETLNGKIENLTEGLSALIQLQRKDSMETRSTFQTHLKQQRDGDDPALIKTMNVASSEVAEYQRNERAETPLVSPKFNEFEEQEEERALVASLSHEVERTPVKHGANSKSNKEVKENIEALYEPHKMEGQHESSDDPAFIKAVSVTPNEVAEYRMTEITETQLESQQLQEQQEEERALVALLNDRLEKMTAELSQLSEIRELQRINEYAKVICPKVGPAPTDTKSSVFLTTLSTQTAKQEENLDEKKWNEVFKKVHEMQREQRKMRAEKCFRSYFRGKGQR